MRLALADCLLHVCSRSQLDLSRNQLGPEGAKALTPALVRSSLTSLSVASNGIVGDGAQQLASAVLAKPNLEVFSGIPLKELRADSLTSLDLSDKGLGVPEAIVLADLLRSVSPSLTSVRDLQPGPSLPPTAHAPCALLTHLSSAPADRSLKQPALWRMGRRSRL